MIEIGAARLARPGGRGGQRVLQGPCVIEIGAARLARPGDRAAGVGTARSEVPA